MVGVPWPKDCDLMLALPLRRHLLIPSSDLSIAPELAIHGGFDEDFAAFLATYLREGMTCVDVGANYGVFAIQMATLVGETGFVHAFEPNPIVADYLTRNLRLNWLADRATVYQLAIGAEEADAVLTVPETMHGTASLVVNGWGEPTEEYLVRVAPLDEVVEGPIDLLKIDVEGYEARVLAGARRLIDEGMVRCLAVEYRYDIMPASERAQMEETLVDLSKVGYRFTVPESIREIGLTEVLETHQYQNLILMREERSGGD